MKLRKKDFKVPKNLSVPRWRFPIFHRGNSYFLGMKLWGLRTLWLITTNFAVIYL